LFRVFYGGVLLRFWWWFCFSFFDFLATFFVSLRDLLFFGAQKKVSKKNSPRGGGNGRGELF
jgi:hypothetical protein